MLEAEVVGQPMARALSRWVRKAVLTSRVEGSQRRAMTNAVELSRVDEPSRMHTSGTEATKTESTQMAAMSSWPGSDRKQN